jgi:hypothetical protein
MVGFRDFFDAFKGTAPGGETAAGTWRYLESYARFSGMGATEADIELPEGKAIVSNEEIREVEGFEIEVTGPDGEPVPVTRFQNNDDLTDQGMHNLFRVGEVDVKAAGVHHIRVKGTAPEQELVILVGKDLSATDAMLGTFGGRGDPFKRR